MGQVTGDSREDSMQKYKRLKSILFAIYFILANVLILSLTFTALKYMTQMIEAIDGISPLNVAQKIEYLKYKEKFQDDIVILSFYIIFPTFIVAWISSYILTKKV